MPESPKDIDQSEDCEELDEDYFASLGNTFAVVDTWNENDEIQVKIEQDEDSNHSKASSRISLNNKDPETKKTSRSRDSRSNTRKDSERNRLSSERSKRSPERKRSPAKRRSRSPDRSRFSPRRNFDRNYRNDRIRRSPPLPRNAGQFDRRRPDSPDRNRNQYVPPKKSFLEEMQEKFAKEGRRDEQIDQMIQQGGRIDLKTVNLRPESSNNFQNSQMHFNNQPNQMPVFMNDQMMPQHFNPLMIQQLPPIQIPMQSNMMNIPNMQFPMSTPPVPANIFNNPLEIMQQPAPLPVPPPQIEPTFAPGCENMQFPQISSPILYNNNSVSKQPVTIVRENVERPASKKTPNATETGGKNLIDILRQKSKQNTKASAEEELASKKAKVLDRCKSAVGLITDLEQNKSKLPLTCVLSNLSIAKPNRTDNKSPLLYDERNPGYLFQATPDQCFSVLENHPLRNIYNDAAEIAQYLKIDLHELSSTVARELIIRPPLLNVVNHEPIVPSTSKIQNESTSIFSGKKTFTKEVQTDQMICKKCHQMDKVKQSAKSKSCQTDNEVPKTEAQCEIENGTDGFRVFIDAQTLSERNFEQHHALEVFSRAFGIECPVFERRRGGQEEQQLKAHEEMDERWNFTNPVNPNQEPNNENFFSTSPIQNRPISPTDYKSSNSPKRYRRSKTPPKFHRSRSPYRISSPQYRTNSPYRYGNSPYRRRESNSPPRHRISISPPKIRPNLSVFDRIGEKIEDSPRNYDNWDDEYDSRTARNFPYRIPSPQYPAPRERSLETTRTFRNKSRSPTPKRYRGENKILNRRGRY